MIIFEAVKCYFGVFEAICSKNSVESILLAGVVAPVLSLSTALILPCLAFSFSTTAIVYTSDGLSLLVNIISSKPWNRKRLLEF